MNETAPSIAIDPRKHRIRIHKTTLHALGDPKYIQLLVNPNDRIIAVQGLDTETTESHKVSFSKIALEHSFEIYSLRLIQTLTPLIDDFNKKFTYKFFGEFCKQERMVLFRIQTVQKVTEG